MRRNKHQLELILDSSFLMHMAKKPIVGLEKITDWAIEAVVLQDIARELDAIRSSGDSVRISKTAALASRYAETLRKVDQEGNLTVDDKLIIYAEKHGAMVATLDVALRRKLLNKGIPVVSLKNERTIMVVPKIRRP